MVAEAGRGGVYYEAIDETAIYAARLLSFPFRSATGRYGRLIDDIGSDIERIDPFLEVARRVADMDRKREKSLAYVSSLSAGEAANAAVRVGENGVILAWVQRCLGERARSYRICAGAPRRRDPGAGRGARRAGADRSGAARRHSLCRYGASPGGRLP